MLRTDFISVSDTFIIYIPLTYLVFILLHHSLSFMPSRAYSPMK
ncbi:hypothetical protein HMPREF9406_0689 [Clostridium sp. HGF2]|nr:hypothetical protein HMPREF9406_0689 [Clostridium sp. HGF2]